MFTLHARPSAAVQEQGKEAEPAPLHLLHLIACVPFSLLLDFQGFLDVGK